MRLLFLCALLLGGAPALAAGKPAALEPVEDTRADLAASHAPEPTESPATILVKEPAYRSERPLYLALELGDAKDRFISGVLDESAGTGSGYDTLYLDANHNGDLTDDAPVKLEIKKERNRTEWTTGVVPVKVKYCDGATRALGLKLRIETSRYAGLSEDSVSWSIGYSIAHRLQGKVDIGGKEVLVALLDGEGEHHQVNGCFDDYGVDRLLIDVDGKGTLDPKKGEFPLSKGISFGGKLWSVETNAAATRLLITPCDLPAGKVKFAAKFPDGAKVSKARANLTNHAGYAFACDLSGETPHLLPAGEYRVPSGTLTVQDAEGTEWTGTFSLPKPICIEPDKESAVAFGVPVSVEPLVTGRLKLGGAISVAHRFIGAGGERYSDIAAAGKREAPSVKLLDAEGIEVAQGKMEYG